jgi:hypothetical protein
VNQAGKPSESRTSTIARPTPASVIADAKGVATTGPDAASSKPPATSPPAVTTKPPSDAEVAKGIADFTSGDISARALTELLAGGNSPSGAAQAAAQIPEVTRLTIDAATAAYNSIRGQKLPLWTGELRNSGTDWTGLFQRAASNATMRQMLTQLRDVTGSTGFADPMWFTRPMTLAEIPPALIEARVADVQNGRKQLFALAQVDCMQTSWLARNGVLLAVIARDTQSPERIAQVVAVLEGVNRMVPLQRPGAELYDARVPISADGRGEGVWLATAWGIRGIVEICSIMGDLIPAELRDRLRTQVRDEVRRICEDWRDQRPWFVRVNTPGSNQWMEVNLGLIEATLFLGDPLLLPAYNLGVENLNASLKSQGAAGEFLEGFAYAQATMGMIHETMAAMRVIGDLRIAGSPFAQNNWRWFAQMHLPGAMVVNCNDNRQSFLPDYCFSVPYSSFAEAAMASGESDAAATMRFLYPNPRPIGSLDALRYADYLASNTTPAQARLPLFVHFPAEQLVVWRTAFEPIEAPQTALALWLKGGTTAEGHCRREQGHFAIHCGNRVVMSNCGTTEYSASDYTSGFAGPAGSNVMQIGGLTPTSQPVDAPMIIHSLGPNGGDIDIDMTNAYVGASCIRNVVWSTTPTTGTFKITDNVGLSSAAVGGSEFYRFHTGSIDRVTIAGSGTRWTVSWPGTMMNIESNAPITLEQVEQADTLGPPNHHQAIRVFATTQADRMTLTTTVLVDRSVTN